MAEQTAVDVKVFPNPSNDVLIVQLSDLVVSDVPVYLLDMNGKIISEKTIAQGSTIAYFDVSTLYAGNYLIKIGSGQNQKSLPVTVGE